MKVIGRLPFHRLFPGVWPLLAGVLLASAYPPFNTAGEPVWFALVPLFLMLRRVPPRDGFKFGFLCGVPFWIITLCWFPAIIKNNGPWVLVLLGWMGLSGWCALFFGAFGFLSAKVWGWARSGGCFGWRRLVTVAAVDPLLWVGLEWVRGWLLSGFAWNFLGVSQSTNLPIIQIASVAGVYGVSYLIILGNEALASLAERMALPIIRRIRREPVFPSPLPLRIASSLESLLPFVLILVVWGWGGNRLNRWRKVEAETPDAWQIALIQPNAPCVFQANRELARVRFEGLRDQTRLANLANPDLIVWPETATPGFLPGHPDTRRYIQSCLSEKGAPLLTGTVEADGTTVYNAAWLVNAAAEKLGGYRKRHLVPFGEYIPLDKVFPILQRLAPTGESCTPGDSPSLITLANDRHSAPLRIGTVICFEDTVPGLCRSTAKAGADLLALLTNDAWFNHSCEALQHQQQSVFRAVETGLPMVRAANSGITCYTSPVGKIRQLQNGDQLSDFDGFLSVRIPAATFPTPYVRWGDALLALPGALLALLLALPKRISRKKKQL